MTLIMISVYTPPTAPIRLMTAFPALRSGFGVKSGINATAGERYNPMETRSANRLTTNNRRFLDWSAYGTSIKNVTARAVPPNINGIRFPIGVSTLSERLPKIGSRNKASTLSAAMIAPVTVSPRPKEFFKINGITLSYICQNAEIDKNARPISMVLL